MKNIAALYLNIIKSKPKSKSS